MGRFYLNGHRWISPMEAIVRALAFVHLFRDLRCHGIETPSGLDPTHRPEYCTMFHHMVKSGGTSIRDRLTIASNKHSLPPPGLCVLGAGSEKACLDSLQHSSVIVGYVELLRKPMEELGRQCQYFTMMRHPIDRLISAFYYCPRSGDVQTRPSKWCGEEKDDQPLEERLLEFAREDWKCKAMLQLSFSHYCPPGAFCEQTITPNVPTKVVDAQDWEILAYAEKILLSYDAVGIREEWELSMRLFDAKIRSPVEEWNLGWLRNPGPQTGQRAALLEWARSSTELRQILAGDLLLYDLALSIFKRQTEEALGVDWRVPRKINEEAP